MDEEDMLNANAEASGSQSAVEALESPRAAEGAVAEGKGMSKNAQKKAARMARQAELKPAKRLAEKIRRQERAHQLSEGYAAGTLTEVDKIIFEERRAREREKRNAKKLEKIVKAKGVDENGVMAGSSKHPVWGGAVIIDLGFDELMTDNEIASMDSQLAFSYSVNRLSALPFSALIHTSGSTTYSPRLMGRLSNRGYERWSRCHWLPETLDTIVETLRENQDGQLPSGFKKGQELVYLSADSEEELTELDPNHVYIIGGLVDRNRHKNLCQNKAERLGIRTARLPIGTYIDNMPTRKVLTVNQVFAILVEFNIRKDWKEAFESVIPPRKFIEKKRKRGKRESSVADGEIQEGEAGEEDGEDEDEDHGGEAGAII